MKFHISVSLVSTLLCLSFLWIPSVVLVVGAAAATSNEETRQATPHGGDPAEQLFRHTLQEYMHRAQTRRRTQLWEPWAQLANQLLSVTSSSDDDDTADAWTPTRLQAIGTLEESILTIERAIYEMGQPDDVVRDKALAHLYYAYSKVLLSLTADECLALARNPHTLLIGAEQAIHAASSSGTSQQASSSSSSQRFTTHVCRENAENHLRNAATLDATHRAAETTLAELLSQQAEGSHDGIHQRKPKEFVAELFDSFADSFDEKLVKGLAYKVPALVGQAARAQQTQYHAVLDAGCGTGLAGRYLKPLVVADQGIMIGVDASQKMLDIAQKCTVSQGCGLESPNDDEPSNDAPLYDGLLAMDLEEMSLDTTLYTVAPPSTERVLGGFDLVVAADVLVYFGRLDSVLASFAAVSSPGAVLIFSCERTTNEEAPLGWRLLPSGRFAHTKEHAIQAAAAAGYALKEYVEIVPRMEKGEPVQGHMFTFILSPSNHSDEL